MKITTFNPQIMTKNADPVVKLFEELGFEKSHDQLEIGELKVEGIRMKDANGFHVDVSVANVSNSITEQALPHDMVAIRMNVDDYDEAYSLLKKHGFTNVYGEETVKAKTSKSAVLISPSGFAINVVQHIKKQA